MKISYFFLSFFLFNSGLFAQTNEYFTHAGTADFMLGNFSPEDYLPNEIIDNPYEIGERLLSDTSSDSLKQFLVEMSTFDNRNTASDTISEIFGMGAARRWAFNRMAGFSERLKMSYLEFEQPVCGIMNTHRNVVAILPGTGNQHDELILIEAHFDSRCEDACDVECLAHGMEDNGSGSALVMELARVMSQFTFSRTIVFMLTTGEEQGLYGGNAMAKWCKDNEVKLNAVYNNDIIGGVICGETASPPGCPGLNAVDSINVRVYSAGGVGSKSRMLARYAKLEYDENIKEQMPVQTEVNLLSIEDRQGRGGDHIPFRQKSFAAIRFTSANEHGDGNPSQDDYHDRQHSNDDFLGEDTDGDGEFDNYFVDFNYLRRNAIINGNAIATAAAAPIPPINLELEPTINGLRVTFEDENNYGLYRIGVRSFSGVYFDSLYTTSSTDKVLTGLDINTLYVISVCTVDDIGIESLFLGEKFNSFSETSSINGIVQESKPFELLQNKPNPFDEATMIGVLVNETFKYKNAFISVRDMEGKELVQLPIDLNLGLNELVYGFEHHRYIPGTYAYSLIVDGKILATKRMIYAY